MCTPTETGHALAAAPALVDVVPERRRGARAWRRGALDEVDVDEGSARQGHATTTTTITSVQASRRRRMATAHDDARIRLRVVAPRPRGVVIRAFCWDDLARCCRWGREASFTYSGGHAQESDDLTTNEPDGSPRPSRRPGRGEQLGRAGDMRGRIALVAACVSALSSA